METVLIPNLEVFEPAGILLRAIFSISSARARSMFLAPSYFLKKANSISS
jgi:hypothetical protein